MNRDNSTEKEYAVRILINLSEIPDFLQDEFASSLLPQLKEFYSQPENRERFKARLKDKERQPHLSTDPNITHPNCIIYLG